MFVILLGNTSRVDALTLLSSLALELRHFMPIYVFNKDIGVFV